MKSFSLESPDLETRDEILPILKELGYDMQAFTVPPGAGRNAIIIFDHSRWAGTYTDNSWHSETAYRSSSPPLELYEWSNLKRS